MILRPERGTCGDTGATGDVAPEEAEACPISPSPSEDRYSTKSSCPPLMVPPSSQEVPRHPSPRSHPSTPLINTWQGIGGRAEGSSFLDVDGRGDWCRLGAGLGCGQGGRGMGMVRRGPKGTKVIWAGRRNRGSSRTWQGSRGKSVCKVGHRTQRC